MPKAGDLITPTIRLERQLGSGGMGSVWVADHAGLRTQVVVKFMHDRLIDDTEHRQRFSLEAATGANVKSPHVVQVLDHGLAPGGAPFIVMELLEGSDLAAYRGKMRMSLEEVDHVVGQTCKALFKAHERGIVHRDIKPQNIFVTNVGGGELFVKVLDFGIAKATESKYALSGATRTGAIMGTPYYMSPEQMVGAKGIDPAIDLWALGVVAFECLTAQRPFDAETIGGMALAICSGPMPVPSGVNPALPPGVDEWFSRACARDASRRFSSAQEMADALHLVATGRPSTALRFVHEARVVPTSPLATTTTPIPLGSAPMNTEILQGPKTTPSLGITTKAPVSESDAPGPAHRTARRATVLGVSLVGVLLASGGAALVLRARPSPESTPTVSVAEPTVSAAPPPRSASAAERAPAAEATASTTTGSGAPSPAVLDAGPPPSALSGGGADAARAPRAPALDAAPAAPSVAPKPNCSPPYVIDSLGDRQYKPECL